jgi:hypothetical protein
MTTYPEVEGGRREPGSVREALMPYLGAAEPGPFAKLSISLPESLLATVRDVAAASGVPVSGVIAASLRRLVEEVAQTKLDAALEADNEERLALARAATDMQGQMLDRLAW